MVRLARNLRRFSMPLSIMKCTDKLRQNDPGFVELSLERIGEDFDLEDFVRALGCNSSVRHVCFSGTFVRELKVEQWDTMLASVGYLQGLRELQIWCSTVPVRTFTEALRRAHRLTKVYLFRVTLAGGQDDFEALARVLRDHEHLRDFRLSGFMLTDDAVSLDSVVYAMSQMTSLEVVNLQLTGARDTPPFSAAPLLRLVCSPRMKDLYLSRLGLRQEHFVVLSLGLAASSHLKLLDLFGNNVENEYIQSLMMALVRNRSLETLVLPCPAEDLTLESCVAVSYALRHNRTLTTLNLPRSSLKDEGVVHIAEGLAANNTLKKIEVGICQELGDKGRAALEHMLDRNYDLERLVVSGSESSIKDKVDYYMRLNEVGRGTLFREFEAKLEPWVDMLVLCKDNLDCLFYFLKHNPALCSIAHSQRAHVMVVQEVRVRRRHTMDHYRVPYDGEPSFRISNMRRASAL